MTETNNICVVNYGTGLTSCLSVRLSEVCEHRRKYGTWPDEVDSSAQFFWYRNDGDGDISGIYLRGYDRPDDMIESSFHHMWQFHWYDDIDLYSNHLLANLICPPSIGVSVRADALRPFVQNRCAVVYRGNDKAKEIPPTPYEAMTDIARQSGFTKFFLQTDDENFLQHFKMQFPDTLFLNSLPRIQSNHDKYVMPVTGKKDFAFEFNSVLLSLKYADGLITNTGNVGLWCVLYRGTLENTWQFHGQHQTWRRLG